MRYTLTLLVILPLLSQCQCASEKPENSGLIIDTQNGINPYSRISDIPLPVGYERMKLEPRSFGLWLRELRLKRDKTVYLFNGKPKENQLAQFAVIDMPVGNKDLQQCADAIMRLRATYLYRQSRYDEIVFFDNNRNAYRISANTDFEHYLEMVFSRCGTLSLEKQLLPVGSIAEIQPGYVFIKGGSPGHAVVVVDVATNKAGKKIFILAQSYMPAQQIHILVNPLNEKLSPWYEVNNATSLITPEWIFRNEQLRKF